jgi:hypothetical protein
VEVDELLDIVRDEITLIGKPAGPLQEPLLEIRERTNPAVDLNGHTV